MNARALAAFALLAPLACVGTTGGDLVTFDAAAAGPADAVKGQPLIFTTGRGYRVTLTKATLHVGAIYLNRSAPSSGSQETSCVLPGTYVGEVLAGLDVDALDPAPQAFPARGDGTTDRALAGEIWLTGGDVNATGDPTVIAEIAGIAELGAMRFPFTGRVTIGQNRATGSSDPSQPGLNPPCKQRIVSPIPTDLTPSSGGALLVRVDPRGWLANVDFAELPRTADTPPSYTFDDSSQGQPSYNWFKGLHAAQGVYAFEWRQP